MLSTQSILPMLERAGYGGMVYDRDRRVVAGNNLAHAALSAVEGFAASDQAAERRISTVFIDALKGDAPVFFDTRNGRGVVAQRFSCDFSNDQHSLLVLANLNRTEQPQVATLRGCFGLTPCEARLAAALAHGRRLDDIAKAHGVGVGTVRGQLKSVFLKTATGRQAELVALLSRLSFFF